MFTVEVLSSCNGSIVDFDVHQQYKLSERKTFAV